VAVEGTTRLSQDHTRWRIARRACQSQAKDALLVEN